MNDKTVFKFNQMISLNYRDTNANTMVTLRVHHGLVGH